jgi:hypothetical protein
MASIEGLPGSRVFILDSLRPEPVRGAYRLPAVWSSAAMNAQVMRNPS